MIRAVELWNTRIAIIHNSLTLTKESDTMNTRRLLAACMCIGLMLAIEGCSKDDVTGLQGGGQSASPADVQAMKTMVEGGDSVSEFSASEIYSIDDNGMQGSDYDILAKAGITPEVVRSVTTGSLVPLRWGRHIFWDQIVRHYDVTVVGDSQATVAVTKTIPGEFWIGFGTRTADSVVLDTLVKKPFTEIVKRNIIFRRVARFLDARRNWVPVAITMVQGKSEGTSDFSIASLELSESHWSYNTTITDPLNTWFRLGWLHRTVPLFPAGDTITLKATVISTNDSAEIVYLRHGVGGDGFGRRRIRMNLVSTIGGPGNYTRVYKKQFMTRALTIGLPGRFNAVIDVFSYETIFDPAAPFSNEFWGCPYIVARH